jgi:hypothetical protein
LEKTLDREIKLELVSGGFARLTLAEPGEFESFYVFSMEHSGNVQFWRLLTLLMSAAGRSLFAFDEALRQQGLNQRNVTRSGMRDLLCRRGYGFGIFFDVDPTLNDVVAEGQKLLLLRDPREILLASYHHLIRQAGTLAGRIAAERNKHSAGQATPSFAEFLQSPAVGRVAERYRRFAELWRDHHNATLFRYEHALSGWHAIAAEIVARLKLPLDPLTAALIAADAPAVRDRLPDLDRLPAGNSTTVANGPSKMEIADLETRFADVLAAFGYVPQCDLVCGPAQFLVGSDPVEPSTNIVVSGMPKPEGEPRRTIRSQLGAIYETDPVLTYRLKPNASAEMHVLGRRVTMDVDATGCRPVVGQIAEGEKTLAVYGCSFTYGVAISAEETFCSLLQGMFPTWRIENHGVSGYGASQNLIQLQRETRWNQPELVSFCWIEQHLFRNVADISWIKLLSESRTRPAEERMARAGLGPDGTLEMGSVRFPRLDLLGVDFADFAPNRYYVDLVCFRLFERANAIVTGYGGHFFVTTLKGHFSAGLAGRLAESGIPVVDAILPGDEYTCLPDDYHPNALAHRIYAERIRDYVLRFTAGQRPAR